MELMSKNERRQARVLALQVFFCFEQEKFSRDIRSVFDDVITFGDVDEEQKNEKMQDENGEIKEIVKIPADSPSDLDEKVKNYALEIAKTTAENLSEIDTKIDERTKTWGAFERINPIDRNLLRIAIAEMGEKLAIPPKVVINEAVEIAKMFGTDDSAKFVNAVLDKIKGDNPQWDNPKPEEKKKEKKNRK